MARFIRRMRDSIVLTTLLCCLQVFPPLLLADESPVKMQKFEGSLDRTGPGPTFPFALSGEASHLGKFTGVGEVAFVPGPQPDSETGSGVVVLTAADGDQLVGVVTWDTTAPVNDTHISSVHFSWRDSITFNDGSEVHTTGHFIKNRPPGLVIKITIICILGYCFWIYR